MWNRLTIGVVLVILISAAVGMLKGQSAPLSPPKERIAKTDSSQNGKKQPESAQNQKAPVELTAADIEEEPAPCDEACQQGRRNLEIQGKLQWFTGVLAVVGVLQVGTMIWQAFLLWQTRGDIHTQAEWMKTSAGHMKEQTAILGESVAAAQKAAAAAEMSAKAATGVAVPTLILYQCIFETSQFTSKEAFFRRPAVTIKVKNFGQSPALLKRYAISFTCEDFPIKPSQPHTDWFFCDAEETVDPQAVQVVGNEGFVSGFSFGDADVRAVINGKRVLRVYGSVEYRDVFGSPVRTMDFCKVLLSFSKISRDNVMADCENCGQDPDQPTNPN